MKTDPLISVILPTHNDERYIESAVNSILSQTFANFELIIINDGSTDGTESIIDSFTQSDSRVIVIHQPKAGIVAALNLGLLKSKGEYIARMDGDDFSLPERFHKQIGYLQRNPNVAAVGSGYSYIDENSKHIKDVNEDYEVNPSCLYGPSPRSIWICHPAAMIRKSALIKVGGYRYYRHSEDADLWMRLEEIGDIRSYPEPLFQWRSHPGRVSIKHVKEQKKWHALALIFARRRREGLKEYDLSNPQSFEDVYGNLTSYEKDRFKAIVSLLNYDFEATVGGNAASPSVILEFIKGYKDNPAAGLSFVPNHIECRKVSEYPNIRVVGHKTRRGRNPRGYILRKIALKYVLLSKNITYAKISRIHPEELLQLKLDHSCEIEKKHAKPPAGDDKSFFDISDYSKKNIWGNQEIGGVKMLQQTFNILPRMSAIYVECSKNACTSVKIALNLHGHIEEGKLPSAGNVHYKKHTSFLGVEDLSVRAFEEVLNSNQWYKFCICRNPYERLVSGYLDKVAGIWFLPEKAQIEYLAVAREILHTTRNWADCLDNEIKDHPITFDEFIEYLAKTESFLYDRHWLSQSITMRPDMVSYDQIIRFEAYNIGMMKVCEDLSLPEYVREALLMKQNGKRSSRDWKSFYSEKLAFTVYNLYKDDFEAFNYSSDCWK